MPPRLRSPRVRLLFIAGAMTLLTGCGLPGFLKVSAPADGTVVKKLSTDLAFGADSAAPSSPRLPSPGGPLGVLNLTGPSFAFDGFADPVRPFEGFRTEFDCPQADENTFPEKSAAFLVDGAVRPGTYKWKQQGTFDFSALIKVALPPLTRRTVRALPSLTPGIASYEMQQQAPTFIETDTYEVRQTNPSVAGDGIYLTRIQYKGKDFDIDFNPLPGLAPKLVSLPVQDEPVAATSIDPASGLVLNVSGSVNGRERVRLDACGEVVEAWKFANGVRILQGLPPNQADSVQNTTYEFYFAPQLGGLIVGDHIVTHANYKGFQTTVDNTTNIGGLTPIDAK